MNVFSTIMLAQASLPRLSIAQRVVDKIARNAAVYATETGESLVGFAIKQVGRPEPDLYIIDTIAPDDSAIRRGAYFEQGDDLQGDVFNWWSDNWKLYREKRRSSYGNALAAKWDVPLMNLGDWHKHPGTLIEPSWGDSDTARSHIFDDEAGIPQLVAILATVWGKSHAEAYEAANSDEGSLTPIKPIKVSITNNEIVRIDCWYMSRLTRRFVRLVPNVIEDDKLPQLPTIAWTLTQPERLAKELAALQGGGYSVSSIYPHDADDQPPLEICLTVLKRNSVHAIIVVTDADYPSKRPVIRTTPLSAIKDLAENASDADIFDALWKASQPVSEATYPEWKPDQLLVELVRAVEAKLESKLDTGNTVKHTEGTKM